jgi:hypothetical protein
MGSRNAYLWLAISVAVSVLGGWHSLANDFRAGAPLRGARFRFASGSVGHWPFPVVAYGNCLFVTVSDAGFRLAIFFPFRFMSPPLFIPWDAIESVSPGRFLFSRYSLIRLNRGWPVIALRGAAGDRVAARFSERASAP